MLNNVIKEKIISEMPIIPIKTKIGVKFLMTSEILYVKASKKFSFIILVDLKMIETIHPIKWFYLKLQDPIFFRCHNSYMVNCLYFNCLCGYQLILENNAQKICIPLSRGRKSEFIGNIVNLYKFNEIHNQPDQCNKFVSLL